MRRRVTVSDWLRQSGLTKANAFQFSASLIGSIGCALAYAVTDQYLERASVCLALGIFQAIILLAFVAFGGGKPLKMPIHRFLMAVYLPVALAPAALLLLDRAAANRRSGIPAVVLGKSVEAVRTRNGPAQNRILTLETPSGILRRPVPWSLYEKANAGDSIRVELEIGALGFKTVTGFQGPSRRPPG